LGDKPIAAITGKDLFALIHECRTNGVPGRPKRGLDKSESRARHVYSALSAMFKWSVREQLIETSPMGAVPQPVAKRRRARRGLMAY
jgi:hypothetical protein